MALSEINSKNYHRILEVKVFPFKVSLVAGLSGKYPRPTAIIARNEQKDKGENRRVIIATKRK